MFLCYFSVSGCMLCLVRYIFVISTGVVDCLGRFVPEMTYCVSSGTLNHTKLKLMMKRGCLFGTGVAKVKAISPYHGTPAPPNGMPCLQFEANTTITLLSDDDTTWWQVSSSLTTWRSSAKLGSVGNSEMLPYPTTSALINFNYDRFELWLLTIYLEKLTINFYFN